MEYTVRPEEDGRRLRNILRGSMRISYSAMKSAKWGGEILQNGLPAHTDAFVRSGDRIQVRWEEEKPVYSLQPYPMALKVPYMDDDLMIVDKPAGLASQSSRNHPDDSLENAVYAWLGCPENFIYRPVNRLDKGTGGLMAIARNAHAQHLMQTRLHTTEFRRRYLAMTDGIPEQKEGILDFPIGKIPEASVKRRVDPNGKPCRTFYRVISAQEHRALILLELETGRTHQIRVHLSHIGCPVSGDFLYGRENPEQFPGCFALHSARLRMVHPLSNEIIDLVSLPAWCGPEDEIRAALYSDVLSADLGRASL